MYSARVVSRALSKYLSASTPVAAGPARYPLQAAVPLARTVLPSEGPSEGRTMAPWSPVTSSTRILRESCVIEGILNVCLQVVYR